MLYKASAPGSLMLLGEHAVLHGKHALVCAIDKRLYLTLQPRSDTKIHIFSALGQVETSLSQLSFATPFHFIHAVLKKFQKQLPCGFDLTIESEFSEQVGLGSSAAVTVALLSIITSWLDISLAPTDMIVMARSLIRKVQGLGSGADVAACVLGGVVAFKPQPLVAEKLPHDFPLTAIYSGFKTPTVTVVNTVKDFFALEPKIFKQLCLAIDVCAQQGIEYARAQDWQSLGKVMNVQQGLMDSLGVSTPLLNQLIALLRAHLSIFGAKISGSGLGDCVIGLGHAEGLVFSDPHVQVIPVTISAQGVVCEKI